MTTHASRNTTTGLNFEKQATIARKDGIDISKTKLRDWFKKEKNIDITDYLSWEFRPDEAYYLPETNEVIIYEKKFQRHKGSVDEKLAACDWKIKEYRRLFSACNINKVSYIYVFCDWFKQPRYTKLLEYIKSIDGCDYFFWEN